MTATENPPSKTITEWCNVFLAQGTESYTSSVTFMKQLTVVAISTITYMKNVFNEENYTVASFGGLKLRILKKKCEDEVAQFLSTSLLQAFEAFEKKYLHQLVLCFYEDECLLENLIEYYIFEYSYNNTGVTMNIHTKSRNNEKNLKCTFEDVEKQTTLLIRACIVLMQSCPQGLPPDCDISLRLYYNDEAPEGYQAPGYAHCSNTQDHLEPTLKQSVQLGWVESKHHKLIASSFIKDMFKASREAIPSQNPPQMSLTQKQQFSACTKLTQSDGTEIQLRCPCNKYEDPDKYPPPKLITCQYCNLSQHAACFGILSVEDRVEHCCERCHDEDPTRPTADPALLPLSLKNRECLCIFRRTLEWCCELTAIDGVQIADRYNISAANATKLMKLLHTFNILELNNDTESIMSSKKINHDYLKQTMSKYFQNHEETLADRLLAETLGSQDSAKSDPIGDVLSPMEKVTLQQTSTMGRVIPNTELSKPKRVDSTMKQYQEAIFSSEGNDLDELPLSGAHNPVRDVEKMMKDPEKKGVKRKGNANAEPVKSRLRAGVKNKKARISHD